MLLPHYRMKGLQQRMNGLRFQGPGLAGYEDWRDRLYVPGVEILAREGEEKGLLPAIRELYAGQVRDWPLLKHRVDALDSIRTRRVQVEGRSLLLQNNPARLANAVAPTDPEKIAARPCPLLPENMPPEQMGLPFAGEWVVVCNPLPFSRLHLVLTSRTHVPQTARGIIRDMLRFTSLTGFISLYNAPGSGASIPDHLHLQAGPPGRLPLVRQLPKTGNGYTGVISDPALPQRIFLYADSAQRMETLFEGAAGIINRCSGHAAEAEPRLNLAVISRVEGKVPLVVVHPRTQHRPSCYYEEGERHFMVSPGSVDMAGLVIVPRLEDFRRLDGWKLKNIFRDVCLDRGQFECLAGELKKI